MGEPTPEAYEAAARVVSAPLIGAADAYNPQAVTDVTPEAYEAGRAAYDRPVIAHGSIGHGAGHYDAILDAVDAVWPFAEAQVRAKVAAEIRATDTTNWPGGRGADVEDCRELAARIAEGKGAET